MTKAEMSPPDIAGSIIVLQSALQNRAEHPLTSEVAEAINRWDRDGLISYFEPPYSADVDDTAVALLTQRSPHPHGDSIVSRILDNVNDEGIIHVWLEPGHDVSTDPVVCVNAVRVANAFGLMARVKPSIRFINQHITSKEYLQGTRYYHKPQIFLYFLSKLLAESQVFRDRHQKWLQMEAERQLERNLGPAGMAMMITAGALVGFSRESHKNKLRELQQENGSWHMESLWRFGSKPGYFGSPSMSTALAIEALEMPTTG